MRWSALIAMLCWSIISSTRPMPNAIAADNQPPGVVIAHSPAASRTYIGSPGIAILLLTLCANLLGDALRDVFDPRMRL